MKDPRGGYTKFNVPQPGDSVRHRWAEFRFRTIMGAITGDDTKGREALERRQPGHKAQFYIAKYHWKWAIIRARQNHAVPDSISPELAAECGLELQSVIFQEDSKKAVPSPNMLPEDIEDMIAKVRQGIIIPHENVPEVRNRGAGLPPKPGQGSSMYGVGLGSNLIGLSHGGMGSGHGYYQNSMGGGSPSMMSPYPFGANGGMMMMPQPSSMMGSPMCHSGPFMGMPGTRMGFPPPRPPVFLAPGQPLPPGLKLLPRKSMVPNSISGSGHATPVGSAPGTPGFLIQGNPTPVGMVPIGRGVPRIGTPVLNQTIPAIPGMPNPPIIVKQQGASQYGLSITAPPSFPAGTPGNPSPGANWVSSRESSVSNQRLLSMEQVQPSANSPRKPALDEFKGRDGSSPSNLNNRKGIEWSKQTTPEAAETANSVKSSPPSSVNIDRNPDGSPRGLMAMGQAAVNLAMAQNSNSTASFDVDYHSYISDGPTEEELAEALQHFHE